MCVRACAADLVCGTLHFIPCLKRFRQVQYNYSTTTKKNTQILLYCSCIVVVLHLCGPLNLYPCAVVSGGARILEQVGPGAGPKVVYMVGRLGPQTIWVNYYDITLYKGLQRGRG